MEKNWIYDCAYNNEDDIAETLNKISDNYWRITSMTDKNYTKYESYKFAFDQIDHAIEKGFYLEAITICESILADRLLSFLQLNEIEVKTRFTLNKCLIKLTDFESDFRIKESEDFRIDLKQWWNQRNQCLHAIVKSKRGDSTIEIEEFIKIAEEAALKGRTLSRQVANWATSQKRKIIRENKHQ